MNIEPLSKEEEQVMPYFWKYFILMPVDSNEKIHGKEMILMYEETHISQYHWIDLLIVNILCVIWWFNPVIRFYMKAVSENHKYLVDREMLNSFGSQEYQYVLVNYWLKVPVFHLLIHSVILIKCDIFF